jgi:hypothetical protein
MLRKEKDQNIAVDEVADTALITEKQELLNSLPLSENTVHENGLEVGLSYGK